MPEYINTEDLKRIGDTGRAVQLAQARLQAALAPLQIAILDAQQAHADAMTQVCVAYGLGPEDSVDPATGQIHWATEENPA